MIFLDERREGGSSLYVRWRDLGKAITAAARSALAKNRSISTRAVSASLDDS
jgi:hypothetical protein